MAVRGAGEPGQAYPGGEEGWLRDGDTRVRLPCGGRGRACGRGEDETVPGRAATGQREAVHEHHWHGTGTYSWWQVYDGLTQERGRTRGRREAARGGHILVPLC